MDYYSDWRDIPDDTDSAVFSLLWGDIKRVLEADHYAALRMTAEFAPGFEVREVSPGSGEREATAEGWSYAAAYCLGWLPGIIYHVPASMVEYRGPECRTWRRAVDEGIGVAHKINGRVAA